MSSVFIIVCMGNYMYICMYALIYKCMYVVEHLEEGYEEGHQRASSSEVKSFEAEARVQSGDSSRRVELSTDL